MPVSQQVAVPPYYASQGPTSYSRSQDQESVASSRHGSIRGASGLTPPSTSSSAPSPIGPGVSFSSSQLPFVTGPSVPLSVPYASGLPIYSASGFDLLSILARVATRPNPKISLGPVDMTCSFAVVDTRRYDHPIVYASPTFLKLTGYTEAEIVGRNCRFLQSPDGQLQKGEERQHTSPEAVAHMRKSLAADKECQISLINYRKNGTPFINLVTIIPIPGGVHNTPEEADDVVYHVGFQVDLTEQPNAILQKLRDGSYMVNYSNNVAYPAPSSSKDWKANPASMVGVSKQLRSLLLEQDFLSSIPLSLSTTTLSLVSPERNEKPDPYDGNRLLSLMLLECTPDFVLVLSLKGAFLYVAPAVRRVLGYEPEDLAGRLVTDFCHAADVVPLMRELKDSSTTALTLSDAGASNGLPKVVDLLFRMRAKSGAYLWIDCRGRLHVEPGKGRKAIILSGRVRAMPALKWGLVARAGGLRPAAPPVNATASPTTDAKGASTGTAIADAVEQEFWALLSSTGCFLSASVGVRDVLGWSAGEIIGRALGDLVSDPSARVIVEETLALAFSDAAMETRNMSSYMKHRDGRLVPLSVVFYHPPSPKDGLAHATYAQAGAQRRPLVCQIKTYADPTSIPLAPAAMAHGSQGEVFEELDVLRQSSWQYELQALGIANEALRREIKDLEEELQESNTKTEYVLPPVREAYDHAWSGHTGYAMAPPTHMSLKRSWDDSAVDGGGGGGGGRTT